MNAPRKTGPGKDVTARRAYVFAGGKVQGRKEKAIAPGEEGFPEKYRIVFYTTMEKVTRQREGVPAQEAIRLQQQLGVSMTLFQSALGIPPATFKKKLRAKKAFTGSAGYAISDLEELLEIAEKLLPAEDRKTVDIRKWFGDWIQIPQPALAGHAPIEILDQPAGREMVKRVLGALASGAYL